MKNEILSIMLLGATMAHAAPDAKTQRTWRAKCASCHGEDGKGATDQGRKLAVSDLTTREWQARFTDAQLRAAVENGLKRTTKAGVAQEMDGYKSKLQADQIDALVALMRALGPAGAAPAESKPAPAATKPAEAKPAETKPAEVKPAPTATKPAAQATPAALAAAKKAWKSRCASCHGPAGQGSAKGKKLGVGDQTVAAWQSAHAADAILAALTSARPVPSGAKKVKHFSPPMKRADAQAMLAFIRSLGSH